MTTTADLLNPLAPYGAPKASALQERFDPKYVFWNVDTQFDFMRTGGAPGEYAGKLVVDGAQAIEPALARLTCLADKYNVQKINTADWHVQTSKEISATPDFVNTYPEHCMAHTKGAEYVPATKPAMPFYVDWQTDRAAFLGNHLREQKDIVLLKDAFDIFAGNRYAGQVADIVLNRADGAKKTVVVYGVATNVCVDYAVMGLRERKYDVIVPTDAIKHLPHLETHPTMNLGAILNKWKDAGVRTTTVDGIEALLRAE